MQTIKYTNLVDIINNYMYKSGIKDFCRFKCMGTCCTDLKLDCFNTKKCDSSLPCAIFLCDKIEAEIIKQFKNGQEIIGLLREVDKITRRGLSSSLKKTGSYLSVYTREHDQDTECLVPYLNILEDPQKIEVR